MRKVIVFFNGCAPYLLEAGLHLPSIRLEHPDGHLVDLPILNAPFVNKCGECAYAADRDVARAEIKKAYEDLV
ncbi:hypothetical protein [Serratia marcescens]|uniref:hypothetical protein n=1 Tax=Serratia marcescens TaxID=615 RepID=UPI0013D9D0BC|nr:hypothetical protein [Serratia marcescens]